MTYSLSTRRPASTVSFTGNPLRDLVSSSGFRLLALLAANIPLSLLIYQSRLIATLHAIATLAIGLWWAARGRQLRVAYWGAYIVGAEVLWRMANTPIFWEFGKYATAAVFILALLREGRLKVPALPFLFFILLLPSAALTVKNTDPGELRQQLSAYLSGPFALLICSWFFSRLRLTHKQLRQVFLVLIGPLIGVAVVTLFGTLTTPDISFNTASNVATSGGFGPNQVSAALGLGVLLAFFCVLDDQAGKNFKVLLFGVMIFLAVQSALTFSRGGLYNATGAAVLGSLFLLKDNRSRIKFLAVVALCIVIANYVLLPLLDLFTGGALSARFQSTDLTNRGDIAQSDLELGLEHPLLGVGPGQAGSYREGGASPHTEFSRLIAEHGLLGFAAILLILVAGARNVKRARTVKQKAVVIAMLAWSLLFMLNAAMRLVAPSFMFGLTFATLLSARWLSSSRIRVTTKLYVKAQPSLAGCTGNQD